MSEWLVRLKVAGDPADLVIDSREEARDARGALAAAQARVGSEQRSAKILAACVERERCPEFPRQANEAPPESSGR